MSTYNKDPLTPERIARIKRQIAGAHALGGPAYSDCKAILGRPVPGPVPGYKRKPTADQKIEERREERAAWWQATGQ